MSELKNEKITLNIKEAANRIGVCENTMRILSNSTGFPKIKCGRRILIPVKAFDDWINKCGL